MILNENKMRRGFELKLKYNFGCSIFKCEITISNIMAILGYSSL
jgi:hypothetical protein